MDGENRSMIGLSTHAEIGTQPKAAEGARSAYACLLSIKETMNILGHVGEQINSIRGFITGHCPPVEEPEEPKPSAISLLEDMDKTSNKFLKMAVKLSEDVEEIRKALF